MSLSLKTSTTLPYEKTHCWPGTVYSAHSTLSFSFLIVQAWYYPELILESSLVEFQKTFTANAKESTLHEFMYLAFHFIFYELQEIQSTQCCMLSTMYLSSYSHTFFSSITWYQYLFWLNQMIRASLFELHKATDRLIKVMNLRAFFQEYLQACS